jgi:hypothetical protein
MIGCGRYRTDPSRGRPVPQSNPRITGGRFSHGRWPAPVSTRLAIHATGWVGFLERILPEGQQLPQRENTRQGERIRLSACRQITAGDGWHWRRGRDQARTIAMWTLAPSQLTP